MIENEKVKGRKKTILYALSFLLLAICMLFTGVFTTTQSVYASYSNLRDYYYDTRLSECSNASNTNYYRDTSGNVIDFTNQCQTLNDGTFAFTQGASLRKHDLNTITFRLQLLNNTYLQNNSQLIVFADIYKSTGGSSENLVGTIGGWFEKSGDNPGQAVGIKSVYGVDEERYGLAEYYRNFEGASDRDEQNSYYDDLFGSGTWGGYLCSHFADGSGMMKLDSNNYTYITINTKDTTSKYYINFSYKMYGWDEYKLIGSEAVSIYDVCATMYSQDKFAEENMDDTQKQNVVKIAKNTEHKKVKVEYLKQIADTPFAEKITEVMELPVVNNFIDFNDVADYLGLKTGMPVLNAYAKEVKHYPDTETYRVIYNESMWVRGMTADGHEMNNFLSINYTFKDYYMSYVNNGIIAQDMYNWYWNDVKQGCSALAGYDDSEVYGLWGYLIIPDSYTINSFWSEAFSKRNFSGSLTWYSYQSSLTHDKYDKLMSEYNYSWVSYAWGSIIGLLDSTKGYEANSYIFYVNNDNSTTEFIAENGADDFNDTNGALINSGEDLVEDLSEFFGSAFEQWGMYIFGGLGIVIILLLGMSVIRGFFKTKTAIAESKARKRKK